MRQAVVTQGGHKGSRRLPDAGTPATGTLSSPESPCGRNIWLAASLRYLPTSLTTERTRTELRAAARRCRVGAAEVAGWRRGAEARQGACGRAIDVIVLMDCNGKAGRVDKVEVPERARPYSESAMRRHNHPSCNTSR